MMTSTDSNVQFLLLDPSQKQISGAELSVVRSHASRYIHAQKHAHDARHAPIKVPRQKELRKRQPDSSVLSIPPSATDVMWWSPDQAFDCLHRPPALYSAWRSEEQRGLDIFLHDTVQDINPSFNNLHFWRSFVPRLAFQISSVRNLVSTIGHFGLLLKEGHNRSLASALTIERQAVLSLQNDLATLSLTVQVVCCVLLDALCVLKSDHLKSNAHNKIALQLLKHAPDSVAAAKTPETMLLKEIIAQRSVPSALQELWSPRLLLKYEQIRCPSDYIEVSLPRTPSCVEATYPCLLMLTSNITRLRRNLSTTAYIDPKSRLARDILLAFDHLENIFQRSGGNDKSLQMSLLRQQIEIGAHSLLILFLTGIISCEPTPYVSQTKRFRQILSIARQIIKNHEQHCEHYNSQKQRLPRSYLDTAIWLTATRSYLVTAIWLTATRCQDRADRCTAISLLKSQYLPEPDCNRALLSQIAEVLMRLEQWEGQLVEVQDLQVSFTDDDVRSSVRLVYTLLPPSVSTELGHCTDTHEECFEWIRSPEDSEQGIRRAVLFVLWTTILQRKASASQAPEGFIWPMRYDGESVVVIKGG